MQSVHNYFHTKNEKKKNQRAKVFSSTWGWRSEWSWAHQIRVKWNRILPLVQALSFFISHLTSKHHFTDPIRRLPFPPTQATKDPQISTRVVTKEKLHADQNNPKPTRKQRRITWWGRALGREEPDPGRPESRAGVSDQVSRSAVEVWGFLTGVLLSIKALSFRPSLSLRPQQDLQLPASTVLFPLLLTTRKELQSEEFSVWKSKLTHKQR